MAISDPYARRHDAPWAKRVGDPWADGACPPEEPDPVSCHGCGAQMDSDADEFQCDDCGSPVCNACEKTTHKCP